MLTNSEPGGIVRKKGGYSDDANDFNHAPDSLGNPVSGRKRGLGLGNFLFSGRSGRPFSPPALIVWGISWAVAAMCAGIYLLLNHTSIRAQLILMFTWSGISGLFALLALTAAALQGIPEMIPAPTALLIAASGAGVASCRLARRRR